MFDPGVIYDIEGINIDKPFNALSLSIDLHKEFRDLRIYFEADTYIRDRYTIKTTRLGLRVGPQLPVTWDLFIASGRNIDPPSRRLLAIHRACCLIIDLSGAGEYIYKVLQDMEDSNVQSDGTTELGSIISLRLHQRGETARVF